MLSDNKLQRLPDSFASIVIEKHLRLDGNSISELPNSFGAITVGGNIDLRRNPLEHLPPSFDELAVGGDLLGVEDLPIVAGVSTRKESHKEKMARLKAEEAAARGKAEREIEARRAMDLEARIRAQEERRAANEKNGDEPEMLAPFQGEAWARKYIKVKSLSPQPSP